MSKESQLGTEIPSELKDLLTAHELSIKQLVKEALEMRLAASSESHAQLEARLQLLKSQEQEKTKQIERATEDREDIREEIARVESMLADAPDEEPQYVAGLDSILDEMHSTGMNVWPEHPKVKALATDSEKTAQEVHEDLIERSDLPRDRFQEGAINRNYQFKSQEAGN